MRKYQVEVTVSCAGVIYVEADSEDKARELVDKAMPDVSFFGCDVDGDEFDSTNAFVTVDGISIDDRPEEPEE
jgi:hypothetical protein